MTPMHPLAEDYLRRLQQAARVLPGADRDELVDQIRGHLAAGVGPTRPRRTSATSSTSWARPRPSSPPPTRDTRRSDGG